MTSSTAPPQQPPSTAAAGPDIVALEHALAGKRRGLRFDPALEHAYERDTGVARTWRQIVCNTIGLSCFWLLSHGDALVADPAWRILSPMRIAVSAASVAIIFALWLDRGSGRAWRRESLSSVGALLTAAYAAIAAAVVGNVTAVMQNAGLMVIFLHVGIAARLQFRYALAVNGLAYVGYAVCAQTASPDATRVLHSQLLLFGVVVFFTTIANHVLEARERRAYLLDRLKLKRHEALLVDAEALRELTVRDALTQLANRRHFDTELARAWGAGLRGGESIGLLQVDVDHFKRYNDHYGHLAGDRCLAEVASALAAVAGRHGGLAARVGGEEFALLLQPCGPATVEAVATEVCAAVRALALPHEKSTVGPHVSVSVGAAALVPAAGFWASSLISAADAALYAAKGAGRDRFARFQEPIVPQGSPRRRKTHDSIPPEHDEMADDLVHIDRFTRLLGGGLHALRFPADLETEFQERRAPQRRRLLAFLAVVGTFLMLVYIALCRPVFPDIADRMLRDVGALAIAALGVVPLMLAPSFGWRVREGLFAAIVTVFGVTMVALEAQSVSPIVYGATLGLGLLPMFSALVAAQSLRFSLVPSLVICIAIATLLEPSDPERHGAWRAALAIVCGATVYTLIGGLLLELASRRAYLLGRLRVAQLAALRHSTEHLQRLALLDPLTRLPNRRHFEAELERLATACARERQPLGLLILDIDHFKRFNDGYGHPAGDACLQRVGVALAQWARGIAPHRGRAATPARIGGEEFGVLLPGSDAPAALAAAQRLRVALRDLRIEHVHSPADHVVTVSVGAASLVLDSAADVRRLLKAADAALYRAKDLGRDRAAA